MIVQDLEDIKKLKVIGHIVAECLDMMMKEAKPGMSAWELDQLAKAFFERKGARSAPVLTYNFPGQTCISVGREAAHGIPHKDKILKTGDLVNIDVSAEKDGYFGDTGGSFFLGSGENPYKDLLKATYEAREVALDEMRSGNPFRSLGQAIEKVADQYGLTIIENLGSHGVGSKLHEAPEFIASFEDKKDKRKFEENMVVTIEPFLSTGAWAVDEESDGWTLTTPEKYRTAQYEHTVVITKSNPLIMTLLD